METYSHGKFQVTGLKINTTNRDNRSAFDITDAWNKFKTEDYNNRIKGKLAESIHCVYFDYSNPDNLRTSEFSVLIGYMTDPEPKQTDTNIETIIIPKQTYAYESIKWLGATRVFQKWEEINAISNHELDRNFTFDMEMYNEDMTEVFLAVGIG